MKRVAVVTGASSGIGEATARLLSQEGWRVLLVARRADRLETVADELRNAAFVAADLTAADAPERVREAAEREGALQLLVNNAGASWRASFADGGYENLRRTMDINFDAPARLTEKLLPLLRSSAPSAIVNVGSVAGRIGRPQVSAYAASKFAIAGWTEALALEEAEHGVHVGLVMPGFVATEGFPQTGIAGSRLTRWMLSSPEKVAQAILDAGPGGKHELYVPRPYGLVPRLRFLFPGLTRRVVRGGRF